jgi:peptide/nickel transport system substrate-binding protein
LFPLLLLSSCNSLSKGKSQFDTAKVDMTPVNGGTYIEASIGDASYLNPLLATDSASSDINGQVFNGLMKYDKNIKLTGDLAESWEIKNDGKEIIFHLRKNVLWHDGQPFTSADVLFTYQKLIDTNTRTAFSSDFIIVQKADAPDPNTFRVWYKEPFAPALESWGIGIIPKHIYEHTDIHTNPANRHPIGTGPYVFREWVTDEKIVLEANPTYFDGRPHLDRYIYRIIPDLSVQFLELRQGGLSVMTPTPDQYNGYDEFFWSYNKFRYAAFRYDYLAFNLENPLFKDKRVRTAIASAIDKKAIIDGVYQGYAVPATGPFPPASWACNKSVQPIPFDVERAKKLLKEAGWSDTDGDGILDKNGKPFEFTIITNQGNKVRESIAQVLQNNLEHIGIKINIRIIEWSVFITKFVDQKQFDALILGWNLSRDPDPYPMWHSRQTGPGQYNFVSYKNPEIDRLLDLGRRTFDPEQRRPIYNKIHAILADDVPYVFLTNPESLPVVHKKIAGVDLAPAGLGWNFKDWYIPKAWQSRAEMSSN